MIHASSDIHPSVRYGNNCTVWAFSVLCEDVVLDDDVVIGSHCFIGRRCHIGRGSRLQSHVFLPPDMIISERCFLGPGVICTNDMYPSIHQIYPFTPPFLEADVSLGAGVIVLPGIVIGTHALIGAGAVVTHDVPAGDRVCGNPARSMRGQHVGNA